MAVTTANVSLYFDLDAFMAIGLFYTYICCHCHAAFFFVESLVLSS